MDGHDGHGCRHGFQGRPDRGLPRLASLHEPHVDRETHHAGASGSFPARRERHHEPAHSGGRGGGGGHRQDGSAADREEHLRFRAAESATGAGGQQDHDRRIGLHGRSIADRDGQASAPAVAGESPERAAKIMRPVVVWITLVTRTSTWEPMRVAACSTTTIVPSSRYATA